MGKVTIDLLRKRAEHNNGVLYNLKEIYLHGQNLEKIELFNEVCRELEILQLQNNLINKIENVGKLKVLRYLNLAINNITTVENLEKCESLCKLDLTLNQISLRNLASIKRLDCLYEFKELHLLGNPACIWEEYRNYVLACLPKLKILDGKIVSVQERMDLKSCSTDLIAMLELGHNIVSDQSMAANTEWKSLTIRVQQHLEFEALKMKNENQRMQIMNQTINCQNCMPIYQGHDDKNFLQKNQLGLVYTLKDSEFVGAESNTSILEVKIPTHCYTEDIKIKVLDDVVQITINDKKLRLKLLEPIKPYASQAFRSKTSGTLTVYMPKKVSTDSRISYLKQFSLEERSALDKKLQVAEYALKARIITSSTNIVFPPEICD